MNFYLLIGIILLSYLFGGIPYGYIVYWTVKKQSIRALGSGNIGATNIFRALGWKWAVLVFLLDLIKGATPILITAGYYPEYIPYAMVATLVGNIASPYLKFRGGKGVATATGIMGAIYPVATFITVIAALIMIRTTKLVSLSSLTMTLVLSSAVLLLDPRLGIRVATLLILVLIIFSHRENIIRLIQGKEKPIARVSDTLATKKSKKDLKTPKFTKK